MASATSCGWWEGTDLGLRFHKVCAKWGSWAPHLGKMLSRRKLLPCSAEGRPLLGRGRNDPLQVSWGPFWAHPTRADPAYLFSHILCGLLRPFVVSLSSKGNVYECTHAYLITFY